MDSLASRLWYWDQVYDVAGIARSEKQERSRKHFWDYFEYCRLTNEFIPSRNLAIELLEDAQILLSLFAGRLENQALTPAQDVLRARLESIVKFDLREWALNLEDDITSLIFLNREIVTEEEMEKKMRAMTGKEMEKMKKMTEKMKEKTMEKKTEKMMGKIKAKMIEKMKQRMMENKKEKI